MEQWHGKVAIVTGANMGIGASICENLVKARVNVVGIVRNTDKMQNLTNKLKSAPGKLYPMECDISKEENILSIFNKVETTLGGVHILVNADAVLFPELIIEVKTDHFRKIVDINVLSVAICTREAVKIMRKLKIQGHIININSITGHFAETITIPVSIYCASKYAITAMTTSIRNELNGAKSNIKITSISPGTVRTEMLVGGVIPKALIEKVPMLETQDVADAVMFALGTSKNIQINELIITPMERHSDN